MLRNENPSLGIAYDFMPVPVDVAKCVAVKAGCLTFMIEGRVLSDETMLEGFKDDPVALEFVKTKRKSKPSQSGITIHVLGAEDGREHLRFDCFADDPHYHYLRHADKINLFIAFDQQANGDMFDWTLDRLRKQLPGMLRFAGADGLAGRCNAGEIERAVTEIAGIVDSGTVQV